MNKEHQTENIKKLKYNVNLKGQMYYREEKERKVK